MLFSMWMAALCLKISCLLSFPLSSMLFTPVRGNNRTDHIPMLPLQSSFLGTIECPDGYPVYGDLSPSQQLGYSVTDVIRACKSLCFNTPVNGDLSSCKRGPFLKPFIFQY